MTRLPIQFGLETEYGISRADPKGLDVVAESIALVRRATAPGVRMRWDYQFEDPHQDARGFRVEELRQDTDEANYFAQDAARPLTFSEIKSDLALKNGARYYNDHAHPEYCTPECSTLLELLQQDHAGDDLVMVCAAAINAESDNAVLLYKNNTDFLGHSYGCHENYLMPRTLPWEELAAGMQAFLVTRQIFCGAGKYGWEEEDRFVGHGFQISQRADFFSELQSVDTMQRRPIVNTRDEPHADRNQWRRFHVIIGDANLAPYSTYLKVGTTTLVLNALRNGAPLDRVPVLADPIKSLKDISRDPKWHWECLLKNGKRVNAIEIQRTYLTLAKEYGGVLDGEWLAAWEAWKKILDDLERDPLSTADRLDWSAKHQLVEAFREAEGIAVDDPWLQSLDLAYHQLDTETGLYWGLVQQGGIKMPYPIHLVRQPTLEPPTTTRAAVRGMCIEKYGPFVEAAQWDLVRMREGRTKVELDLRGLFAPTEVAAAVELIQQATDLEGLLKLPFAKRW